MKWKRREAGSYVSTVNDVQIAIVNMYGQSVKHSGLGAHWHVREGGVGEYDRGAVVVHQAYTFADAKAWAERTYGPV